MRGHQRGQLGGAARERQLGRGRGDRRGDRRFGRGGDERSFAHLLEQRRGLVDRAHAELLAERAHALPVLGQRGRPVAVERVEPDQLAMRRLVQRIEREPAPRVADRRAVLAAFRQRPHQAAEHRAELALQRIGLGDVPRVERGTVADREPLQQVAAEDLDRTRELPVRASARKRLTSSCAPSRRATLSDAASIHCSPTALRSADSVRRSAPRACSGSWSGHSSSQSASRERGRSASARWASSAVALRVSNATGSPSRRTRGGPSSEISSAGGTAAPP